MAKELTSNLSTEIATDEHRPIELYIVYLDNDTLYFTDHDTDVEFFTLEGDAETYVALAIERSEVSHQVDNKVDSVHVTVDNVNRGMSSYIANNEFRGRRLVILRVYEEYLDSDTDYITIFDGIMDSPLIGETSLRVTIKSRLGTLDKLIPRRLYQLHCNYEWGSTECGFDKTSTQQTGKIINNSSTTTRLDITDVTMRGKADNYYRYGKVTLSASGTNAGDERMITFSSGTGVSGIILGLDYALSFSPDGDSVTVQQGCDKTYTTCNELHSNSANYGGFLNIPELMVRR